MTALWTKFAAAWTAFFADLAWTDENGNGPEGKLYGF